MKRRFTDTDKWDGPWFGRLSPHAKLVWFYLHDRCDKGGFWLKNTWKMSNETGLTEEQIEGALKELQRVLVESVSGERLWLTEFLKTQKLDHLQLGGPDSEKGPNMAHKGVYDAFYDDEHVRDFPTLWDELIETKMLIVDDYWQGAFKDHQRVLGLGLGLGLGDTKPKGGISFPEPTEQELADSGAFVEKDGIIYDSDGGKYPDQQRARKAMVKRQERKEA